MEFQSKIMIKVIGLNLIDALAFEKKRIKVLRILRIKIIHKKRQLEI